MHPNSTLIQTHDIFLVDNLGGDYERLVDEKAWCTAFRREIVNRTRVEILAPMYQAGSRRTPSIPLGSLLGSMMLRSVLGFSGLEFQKRMSEDYEMRFAIGFIDSQARTPTLGQVNRFIKTLAVHRYETGNDLLYQCFVDMEQARREEICALEAAAGADPSASVRDRILACREQADAGRLAMLLFFLSREFRTSRTRNRIRGDLDRDIRGELKLGFDCSQSSAHERFDKVRNLIKALVVELELFHDRNHPLVRALRDRDLLARRERQTEKDNLKTSSAGSCR
ncbi:MAG: hypothetical protein IJ523_03435 [Succinivibrionaceae bacterium]|nr:hypothetical protein [Succinivibrionaceae bacterium]